MDEARQDQHAAAGNIHAGAKIVPPPAKMSTRPTNTWTNGPRQSQKAAKDRQQARQREKK